MTNARTPAPQMYGFTADVNQHTYFSLPLGKRIAIAVGGLATEGSTHLPQTNDLGSGFGERQ